ncbi:threonine/serine exporter family protein [Selenomonas sp. TAMA-11512]|uniref:threonine/serine ThrE exporter family protein n=1 Tax=Selenomonas sp. TAMA-11512 TaxID=3095337 RepID=UPI00308FC0DB|nr:threonine/serine exporter family protein [Selenomonas sp. TAMA-11512]
MCANFSEEELLPTYGNIYYKMRLLLRTGELLMTNGADTERILRDIRRAALYMGIPTENIHLHIAYTTLMLNINDDEHSYTEFRKCPHHGVNMTVVSGISRLTWRAIRENYTLKQYEESLDRVSHLPRHYSPILTTLAAGAACGAFTILFGGDIPAFFSTWLAASIGFFIRRYILGFGVHLYAGISIAAFISTMAAWSTQFFSGSVTPHYPLIACTLFIIPGVPLINSIDDLLNNYVISSVTRSINTFSILCSMTFGIVIALILTNVQDFTNIPIAPHELYFSQGVASILGAVGFSIIFNVPKRTLWGIALGGLIAVTTRNILTIELDFSTTLATFVAACLIGIIAMKAVHIFHVPNVILTIPSVIPLIPGVMLYRLLFGIMHIHTLTPDELLLAQRSGVEAATILIAIAVGVTIPTIFIRPYLEKYYEEHIAELLKDRYENEDS